MNEHILALRPVVLWAWLMGTLAGGLEADPVAGYLSLAALLFAAARWSKTVLRESTVALLLLDAPAIFTIQGHQSWPVSGVLFAGVLVAGVLTLRRALAVMLVLEVVVLQFSLLDGASGPAQLSAAGVALVALAAWARSRRTGPA